ncbi:MAG: MBL fold metallo-hydrolase [Anaerolineales bacterium]|nr:MBL fold metallo-hydrolase [Anaerolineales bacterium]
MEITWYGQSCFRLRDRLATVITDPYDKGIGYTLPRARADIVTVSHDHPDHNYVQGVKGEPKIIVGPGEYEVCGVFITGIPTFHDRKKGASRGRNTVFLFDFEGLTVCHLGDLGHVPTQSQVEALSDIDVLLVPVGAVSTINAAQAAEVISLLEPRLVIPMHYKTKVLNVKLDHVSKFLKEMGLSNLATQESLKVTKSSLPEETQVLLLDYKQ